MDQAGQDSAREKQRLEQIVSAASGGIIFVDVDGQVVGLDSTAKHRLNGEVKQLELPISRPDERAVDCVLSAETLMIKGVPTSVCVVQESEPSGREVMSAVESILADTSSFARNIVDRLKVLRFAPSATSGQDLDMLTERERQILGLICEGKGDLEMSSELNLSHNTVRNHVASLYRKIGVNRRSAAIVWVREHGIAVDSLRTRRHRRSAPDTQQP